MEPLRPRSQARGRSRSSTRVLGPQCERWPAGISARTSLVHPEVRTISQLPTAVSSSILTFKLDRYYSTTFDTALTFLKNSSRCDDCSVPSRARRRAAALPLKHSADAQSCAPTPETQKKLQPPPYARRPNAGTSLIRKFTNIVSIHTGTSYTVHTSSRPRRAPE